MQAAPEELPPIGVVFDSDMGNHIDDALALALLHGLAGKQQREARLASVSVTKSNLQAAAFCEAVDRFYSELVNREIPPRFRRYRSRPVGLSDDGKMAEDSPILKAVLSRRNADGEPAYSYEIDKLNDTAEPAALIRNALTAQHNQNAVVVLTGPATNLARVLDVRGAPEIIERKVRFLSVMGGAYPQGDPEFNIQADIGAARKTFAEWPTPIVACGRDIGDRLRYPAAGIETDFAWADQHPIVDAYKAYRPMPYDAATWAMTAALHAVRPEAGYFQISEPGTIQVLDDGRTEFTPSPGGKHSYLLPDPQQESSVLKVYRELVSAMSAPREVPDFVKRIIEEEKRKEEEKLEREKQQQPQQAAP